MRLFAREEVNTSRQFAIDFAKVLSVVGMVVVHCFEVLADSEIVEDTVSNYVVISVVGALFAAGVFMSAMGVGTAYSRHGDPATMIRRGFWLFLGGYLLNIVRDTLTEVILVYAGKSELMDIVSDTLCPDVLQFAGLALMLLGFLRKIRLSDVAILAIALLMSVVGSFLRFITVDSVALCDLAGLFVGTVNSFNEDTVAVFPLLNWFIFVVAGCFWGKMLRRCADTEKFYAIFTPIFGVVLAGFLAYAIPNRYGIMSGKLISYYQTDTFGASIMLCGAGFSTCVCHYASKLFPVAMKNAVTRMSSSLTSVYCIHWPIVSWTEAAMIFFGWKMFGVDGTFVAAAIVFIAANVLAEGYQRIKRGR